MSERLKPALVFLRLYAGLPGHLNRWAEQVGWDLAISVAKEIMGIKTIPLGASTCSLQSGSCSHLKTLLG